MAMQVITKIKLDFPLQVGDKKITELDVRRIKVQDIKAVSNIENEQEAEFTLVSRLTGLVEEDIALLDIVDFLKLQDYIKETLIKKKDVNLDVVLFELAFWFKWQPSELQNLDLEDAFYWFELLKNYLKTDT